MKFLLAVLFSSVSVVILIFATRFDFDIENPKLRDLRWSNLNDSPEKLFWFLQISDLHISKFKDESRVTDFRRFCSEVVDSIQPKVVLASGDLTDAKDNILGSQQYEEEWKAYHSSLVETGIFNKTKWLDIRGNHDNFNVEHLYSSSDLYRNFSAQGRFHKQSYLTQVEVDDVKYNFLALDASVEPGTKRPYNFIGIVEAAELQRVEKLLKNKPANYTVWFAHYPTSTILTPSGVEHIRKFIGKFDESTVFVAGHLHTLANLVFRMYTLQPEGFLELELGDFMRNRLYRLGVFDHGQFSFADVKLGTWPIAVITNPKNILFNNPFKENLKLQTESSHVRIVAFSTSAIVQCKIKIDNFEWQKCEQKAKNFFVVPWHHPSRFYHGKHKIELLVGDADGRIFNQEQIFSLDGSRNSFDFLAKFVLMSDITTVFQAGFFAAFFICLLPLVVFKSWQLMIKYGKLRKPKLSSRYWKSFLQKYLIFACVDRIYYGVLFWLLYTALGPWSFHEILDGHRGYLFVWGTFVKGIFVPGTLNWWYGLHQLMFFQFPLTIILAGTVHRRLKKFLVTYHDPTNTQAKETFAKALYANLPFVALIIAETLLAIFYLIQNGIVSLLFAPMRFWGLLFSIYLFYQAHHGITDVMLKQYALLYSPEMKLSTS